MPNKLTQQEKALAWKASWKTSFEGKAIVRQDFTFRAVNPQFCKIIGTTPGELLDRTFTDITPQPIKDLDIKNAELVIKRKIESYILPKTYELSSGKRVNVILLVNGVYHPINKKFLFFVASIMSREESAPSRSQSQTQIKSILLNSKIKLTLIAGGVTILTALIGEVATWLNILLNM
jgi:PAS domain S-box-containing protein